MTVTLLPPSASGFERAVEAATAADDRFPSLAPLRRAKLGAAAPLVPWLLWEYGLGEVTPYLEDPQRAIREGVLWQRIRGTPAGLRVAFGWRGLDSVLVEEKGPGVHFAEFMVDPGLVPDPRAVLDLIGLARLASPARSRLARIFHGYDIRRFRLDKSGLDGGGLLSDCSGVAGPDGVQLSFGRRSPGGALLGVAGVDAAVAPVHAAHTAYVTGFRLDRSAMDGAKPRLWPLLQHTRLVTGATVSGVPEPSGLRPARRFTKAQVVLSDGPRLGNVNACTQPFRLVQEGPRLILSGGAQLSGPPRRLVRVPVFERLLRVTAQDAPAYDGLGAAVALRHAGHSSLAVNGGVSGGIDRTETGRASSAAYRGQHWSATAWPRSRWSGTREIIGASHATTA
ncbi:phage tail protein [Azospirillum doebereinerae]|uniref:Phage tail protein n=1 Tax=Azospirillum doebereinerae TaxID=92933 RepID=A0A433JDP3_9PROT|nr:phage tail protein [Azospirillum doebereinerae]RUQ74934.1 hypothetical protein EJ913_03425 [Azospirillum doebereinerae]